VWSATGLACWGKDVAGFFPVLELYEPSVSDVIVAGGHACARTGPSIVCAGHALPDQLSLEPPAPLEPRARAMFALHGLLCVGRPGAAQCADEAGRWSEYRDARVPYDESSVLRSGGCWECALHVAGPGRGTVECGSEAVATDSIDRKCPGGATPLERIENAPPLADVAVGDHHACGLTAEGQVWCWGNNDDGEVGVPPSPWEAPVRVELGGAKAIGVAAGTHHSCALASDGAVTCWGGAGEGELRSTADIDRVYAGLRGGPVGMCAWSDDSVLCGDTDGFRERVELRGTVDVEPTFERTAVFVDPRGAADDVYSGRDLGWAALDREGSIRVFHPNLEVAKVHAPPHATALVRNAPCALYADGGVWCWWREYGDAAGGRPSAGPPAAVAPPGLEPVRAVASTIESIVCAIASSDGALWCWGAVEGVFAPKTPGLDSRSIDTTFIVTPRKVPAASPVVELAASGRCARHGDGTVSLLGLDCSRGRCALKARLVPGLEGVARILQGDGCDVQKADGTVESIPVSALLGDPVADELPAVRGAHEIAGGAEPCAVMGDGTVRCANFASGTRAFADVPDITGATHVAVGPSGGCVTEALGGLACFAFAPKPVLIQCPLLGPLRPTRVY
jgi:hypothetical protein